MPTARSTAANIESRIEADPAPAAEAALILALATCPSLLFAFADNAFEPHKAGFLWAAACAGVVAIASAVPRLQLRSWPRWLVLSAICSAVSLIASASFSSAPARAWWGSGLRRYGALTELALLAVLIIAAVLVTNRARLDRVLAAVVLGSVGPTVHALMQWLGVDPLATDAVAWQRPGSTLGNPLFLAGYLVAVVPLTIAYAARCALPLQRIGAWGLVLMQAAALAATRARGPLLAIVVAATVVGSAVLVSRGRRRLGAVIAIVTAVATLAAVLVVPLLMRVGMQRFSALQSEGDRNRATITVRALLWQAAGAGISSEPGALAIGSGPESTTLVLTRYSGAFLRVLEGPNVAPDRAHNETLDTVVTYGAVGLAVRLVILYIGLGAAFAVLGILARPDYAKFAALAIVVTAGSSVAAWLLNGAWTLAISVPCALLIVSSLWIAWRSRCSTSADPELVVPAAMATMCWVAHYLEIQGSIASVPSALAGCIGLALAVTLTTLKPGSPARASVTPPTSPVRAGDAVAVTAGWTAAVTLIALTGAAANVTASAFVLTALVWCIANLVTAIRLRAMAISAAVCLAVALVWLVPQGASIGPTEQGMALANRVVIFYLLSAVCCVLVAWRLTAIHGGRRAFSIESLAIATAAVIGGRAAVSTSTGDVLVGSGRVCEQHGRVDCALALYTEAGRRDPSDERAFTGLARVRIAEADSTAAASRRDELFQEAADQLRRAFAADPFEYHHARNRGSLERRWAQRLPPLDRGRHLEEAERWYAAATALAPSAPALWAEWANLKLERRLPDDALPKLERSAALGGGDDVSTLCDLLLRVIGIDVARSGGLAQAAVTLRERGYPRLAERYATRASAAGAALR